MTRRYVWSASEKRERWAIIGFQTAPSVYSTTSARKTHVHYKQDGRHLLMYTQLVHPPSPPNRLLQLPRASLTHQRALGSLARSGALTLLTLRCPPQLRHNRCGGRTHRLLVLVSGIHALLDALRGDNERLL